MDYFAPTCGKSFRMHNTTLLIVVIVVAVSFDFTNGFHDTANAMATSIATGALKPRVAVALSGILNLLGAFLSVSVAATIASGIVDSAKVTLPIIFAGLLGAIGWNVLTWYFGLPSSSSQALVGGVIGATVVAAGFGAAKGTRAHRCGSSPCAAWPSQRARTPEGGG